LLAVPQGTGKKFLRKIVGGHAAGRPGAPHPSPNGIRQTHKERGRGTHALYEGDWRILELKTPTGEDLDELALPPHRSAASLHPVWHPRYIDGREKAACDAVDFRNVEGPNFYVLVDRVGAGHLALSGGLCSS
jgi:hypothetical protein